jgi:hypothetical protein
MLREDIARAARAALWASAIGVWDGTWPRKQREEVLREAPAFLAHLRAGAVEVQGNLPESVHPWDCALNIDRSGVYIRCPGLILRTRGEVPKTAVEAALAELRSRVRAAGAVVWRDKFVIRPAPPDLVSVARDVVRAVRAKLGDLDLAAALRTKEPASASAAAALAAIEAGNWAATVRCRPTSKHDRLRRGEMEFGVNRHTVGVLIHDRNREVGVRIFAARAPRSMRPAFAAAYMKWYKRVAAAALVEALREAGA